MNGTNLIPPGVLAPGGGSVNRFYLPEMYARMTPSPLPAQDRAAIRAVLETWFNSDGTVLVREGLRTSFPCRSGLVNR